MNKGNFLGMRITSMFLDHIIMSFCGLLISLLINGVIFILLASEQMPYLVEHGDFISSLFTALILPILIFSCSIYLIKDSIKGKSIAKRILGLAVIDVKTKQLASPLKTLVRNFTLVFWPVEVITTLINPERRIGDYIAGTKVILNNENLSTNFHKGQFILAFSLALVYIFLFFYGYLLVIGGEEMVYTTFIF